MTDDAKQYLDALRDTIAAIEETLTESDRKLQMAKVALSVTNDELQKADQQVIEKRKEADREIIGIEKKLEGYRSEVSKLTTEIETLVRRKGELQTDNQKLEQQNRAFKEYEIKAWKALNSKDEDLQARERNLRQQEAITPPPSTFLPPA